MDATGTERAHLVSLSLGAQRALLLAAEHPERVESSIFICPAVPLGEAVDRSDLPWNDGARPLRGLGEVQPPLLAQGLPRLPRVLLLADVQRAALDQADRGLRGVGARHDAADADRHGGRGLDRARHGARPGPAHAVPLARDPGLARRDHRQGARDRAGGGERGGAGDAERLRARPARPRPGQGQPAAARLHRAGRARRRAGPAAAARRRKRALYVSSPIGLGHARRDVAIADELRKLHPDLEIDWLAQHPVTAVLEARGERVHPAQRAAGQRVARTSSRESAEHDLHAFQAIRRMDEILLANFMVFHDVVREDAYDLWIGDEAWDVDYFLHENPELKRAAYAWLTDFVGWLPMPDGGEREAVLTADYNAEMIEQIARYPRRARPLDLRRRRRRHRAGPLRPRAAGDPRLDRAALRLRRLRHRLRSGRVRRPRAAAGRARLPARRAGVPRDGRRLRRRRRAAAPGRSRPYPAARRAGAGPAHDRGRRAAHRPGLAAVATRGLEVRGLRAGPLPPPRGLRPRGRAGRADDLRWS